MKPLKFLIGTLSVSAVLVGSSGCASAPEAPPASSDEVTTSGSAAPVSETTSPEPQGDEVYPVMKQSPDADDKLPVEADLGGIDPDTVRWLGSSSYARQYVATDENDNICFIAWANPGHGDATPVDLGTPGIQCSEVSDVLKQGIGVRVDGGAGPDGLVAHLLPPEMEMLQVKKVILAIPGNHEDLRPPVEINENEDDSITIAMGTETADKLGNIEIPRPDGVTLTLAPTPNPGN